jgi:hypothetical protein
MERKPINRKPVGSFASDYRRKFSAYGGTNAISGRKRDMKNELLSRRQIIVQSQQRKDRILRSTGKIPRI